MKISGPQESVGHGESAYGGAPQRWNHLFELELAVEAVAELHDELLLKLGAAKKEAGHTYALVGIRLPDPRADGNVRGGTRGGASGCTGTSDARGDRRHPPALRPSVYR